MTWKDQLQQAQTQYQKATDTVLAQLNDPSVDTLALLAALQETADAYATALREASQNVHSEASEHYLVLAQEIEQGYPYFFTMLLEYRERHYPQA